MSFNTGIWLHLIALLCHSLCMPDASKHQKMGFVTPRMVSGLHQLESCTFFVHSWCLVGVGSFPSHETPRPSISSWKTSLTLSFLRVSCWQVLSVNMSLPRFLAEYWWSVDKLVACSASCGHKGVQLPQLRCLLDGAEVNISHCKEKPKPALQPIACNRRDCPSRFVCLMLKCHTCF